MTEGLKQGLRGRLREHIDDVFYIAQCLPPKPYTMWARKCDATGKGMNEGYVFGDGEKYFALEMHALEYAQSIGYKSLDDAYDYRAFYWTEWEEDRQYIEIDGKVMEFREVKYPRRYS